jgi:hypothetical protein
MKKAECKNNNFNRISMPVLRASAPAVVSGNESTKQQLPEVTQQSSHYLLLFRGPTLWLFGISNIISCFILLWDYLSSLHAAFLPIHFSILFISVVAWTTICTSIFVSDAYLGIIYPIIVQPVIIEATKYSIDDLCAIICDPSRLATYISALFVLPITLYTLPTTPQQRASILTSIGILSHLKNENRSPDKETKTFTEAGGWKYLLPQKIQILIDKCCQNVVSNPNDNDINKQNRGQTVIVDGIWYHDIVTASTDDDDDDDNNNDDDYDDTSNSEVDNDGTNSDSTTRRSNSRLHRESSPRKHCPFKENSKRHSNQSRRTESSESEPTNQSDDIVFDVAMKVFIDLIQNKLNGVSRRIQNHKSTIAMTAITTMTILVTQLRYSRTARSILNNIMHICITTTSSITLLTTFLAFITPYINQKLLQPDSKHPNISGHTNKATVNDNIRRFTATILSSIMTTNTQNGWSDNVTIPKSIVPIVNNVHYYVSKWKGTIAVFLLAYFQYRYRKIQRMKI